MPELPEVETTCRGITPLITGKVIINTIVRQPKLRWRIPGKLDEFNYQQKITKVSRRAKYILIHTTNGCMILHLGMSGSLRVVNCDHEVRKHDHVDIGLDDGTCLRFHDPRRFGSLLWTQTDPMQHKLLSSLGPEPLSNEFDSDYLVSKAKNKKIAIKNLIMNSHIVVGVGNIYANEALFLAGIRPRIAARRVNKDKLHMLVAAIKRVLKAAIKQGGTTLRDFSGSDGKPGYFKQKLNVYDRAGEPCNQCGNEILLIKQNQRASYYCKTCQT